MSQKHREIPFCQDITNKMRLQYYILHEPDKILIYFVSVLLFYIKSIRGSLLRGSALSLHEALSVRREFIADVLSSKEVSSHHFRCTIILRNLCDPMPAHAYVILAREPSLSPLDFL